MINEKLMGQLLDGFEGVINNAGVRISEFFIVMLQCDNSLCCKGTKNADKEMNKYIFSYSFLVCTFLSPLIILSDTLC